MNIRKIYLIFFSCFFSISWAFAQNNDLIVNIKGLKEKSGTILIAIYSNESSFNDPDKATQKLVHKITNWQPSIILKDLSDGIYAVAAFHDTNANNVIDSNFLGIPTEKYGFSNDARRTFSAPTFDECAFTLNESQEIFINIK